MNEGLTYDDILIVPGYSNILTRADIDIRSFVLGDMRVPIISAPMDTVASPRMVTALHSAGAYGILHRFADSKKLAEDVYATRVLDKNAEFGVSIGVKDWDATREWLDYIWPAKIHSICIDVAHGHHALVGETLENVREWTDTKNYPIEIIAGNVATPDGFQFLADFGATAVRVGIGPGSVCTTRETTGVGFPQLSAIQNIVERRGYNTGVSIIADGGIKSPGDIAKALAVGADAVMLGRLLAGADESPGDIYGDKKKFRGQSLTGSNGARGAPEGISGWVDRTGPVSKTIEQLVHYLRSSFSYVGARNLREFREKAEFIRVSPMTTVESGTRL